MLKNPSKTFLDPHPEAVDSQNLISSSLTTGACVVKFSLKSKVQSEEGEFI